MGEWRMRRFLAGGGTVLACKLFDGFRVKAIAVAGLLLILAAGGLSQSAFAQERRAIPPPPPDSEAPYTQPKQDETDPERAFNPTTGQNMYWDRGQKTWIDSKTGKPVPGGFKGRRMLRDCPPPPTTTTPAPAGVGLLIVEPGAFFDLIGEADARTAGVPKPSEEIQKVEEKKQPSWWETLIPSIGIGVGGGREDKERRFPDDPRR
jgi:hypothetical protein